MRDLLRTARGRQRFVCKWPGCTAPAAGTFTDFSDGVPYRVQVCRRHKKHILAKRDQLKLALA
jgi:hypothetical protein